MYQRILVPVDGSSTSNRGLSEAIQLAKITGGRLRLVHVIDELSFALSMDAYSGYTGDWLKELRASATTLLEKGRAQAAAEGVAADVVLCDTFKGTVNDQVIAQAVSSQAQLIVLGTHGRRGLGRWVMGSSAEHILRLSPVPVLLVRAPEEQAKAEFESFTLPVGEVASQ
ncbi:Nucleotide-binding universal stress protein, UspA family [Variovorax sp. OK605]|uniref:universal stress protein n=1 Tax=Variovorax sp. OK605 TaxID=1855317 RepID=UPI0008F28F4C|nr:universal stress protein [Variovorax sp. OK605]SFQ59979.1 Nucleotide-binding universal stress protein, UspA family [Variovorax sp. OK605]